MLKKVVGGNVSHIAEVKYKNFDGVDLSLDSYGKSNKAKGKDFAKSYAKAYMMLLSK